MHQLFAVSGSSHALSHVSCHTCELPAQADSLAPAGDHIIRQLLDRAVIHDGISLQGLFQAMFMGVGYGLGALLTGLAAQYSPLQLVFAVSGAAMAVGWLVLRFGREVVARMEVGAAAEGGLSEGRFQVTCS